MGIVYKYINIKICEIHNLIFFNVLATKCHGVGLYVFACYASLRKRTNNNSNVVYELFTPFENFLPL
jgi:hypothetical protein